MSATRRISDLGIGRAHHHSQKMPLPQTRLCHFLAAAYITRQEPWVMTGPRGTLELFSSDRRKLGGKISNDK